MRSCNKVQGTKESKHLIHAKYHSADCKLRCAEAGAVDHVYTKDNCETISKTLRNEESATHTPTTKMK